MDPTPYRIPTAPQMAVDRATAAVSVNNRARPSREPRTPALYANESTATIRAAATTTVRFIVANGPYKITFRGVDLRRKWKAGPGPGGERQIVLPNLDLYAVSAGPTPLELEPRRRWTDNHLSFRRAERQQRRDKPGGARNRAVRAVTGRRSHPSAPVGGRTVSSAAHGEDADGRRGPRLPSCSYDVAADRP